MEIFVDLAGLADGNIPRTTAIDRQAQAIDPEAFLTVVNANEILGNGFKSLRDKVSD